MSWGAIGGMSLVNLSLRRPWTVIVAVAALVGLALFGLARSPRDAFPNLGVPTIYVAQPYGGLDPAQMEGFVTYYYEYHFLYITGIEHVESRTIQGASVLKLQFHPGTDMNQAMAETVSYVNRARAFMPAGTVAPFVMRFDAGSVPVGQLVFTSSTRSVGQIQDLALNTIRPMFATLPGVSAPPPFGGAPRTIVVNADPARLAAAHASLDDLAGAIAHAQVISPSGNLNVGKTWAMVPTNATVSDIHELETVPLRPGQFPAIHVGDVASVTDGSDIVTSHALADGRRTVYIPVTKRADASTLAVVAAVKANLARFQAALPDDVTVSYAFDQSGFVSAAISNLALEAGLGAVLTGLMVLLFLGDWRAGLVVVVNIPLALLAALLGLWLAGYTVNLMTLGGLALAVGILVDSSTVTMEATHARMAQGAGLARAVVAAGRDVAGPLLVAMLAVLTVFLPVALMEGAARALLAPLALAVALAMIASWLLDRTLVPVLSVWWLRPDWHEPTDSRSATVMHTIRGTWDAGRSALTRFPAGAVVVGYLLVAAAMITLGLTTLGTAIFPPAEGSTLQLRLRAPAGTRLDLTEALTQQAIDVIGHEAGGVKASLALVGVHGSAYPINFIHQWTSGPHEAVLQVELTPGHTATSALRDHLRAALARELPQVGISFEPADIVSRVLSFGAQAPIEVAVLGKSLDDDRQFAETLRQRLTALPGLRDVHIVQPLDYPAVKVTLDRGLAGLQGVTADNFVRSLTPFTSSSRFTLPVYWAANTGIAYQVQVQGTPTAGSAGTVEDLRNLPVSAANGPPQVLRNVASVAPGTVVGEYDRYNGQRMVTVSANIEGKSLGAAASAVEAAIAAAGPPPRGVSVLVRGEVEPLRAITANFTLGLVLAGVALALLLVGWFQSPGLALVALAGLPAVLAGTLGLLMVTGDTLNLESAFGLIAALGVAVANAILLVTAAETLRRAGAEAAEAAWQAAASRLRPIAMTALAMLAGMLPVALGLGEGGRQTAPLGRALIGGVSVATLATLLVVPLVFALVRDGASRGSASRDPDDRAAAGGVDDGASG